MTHSGEAPEDPIDPVDAEATRLLSDESLLEQDRHDARRSAIFYTTLQREGIPSDDILAMYEIWWDTQAATGAWEAAIEALEDEESDEPE